MNKKKHQVAWQPGMEIESETHYHEVTERLAEELLSEHSPKSLALRLAQHIIYVDSLTATAHEKDAFVRTKEKMIRIQDQRIEILTRLYDAAAIELERSLSVAEAARIFSLILKHFKKAKFGVGGRSRVVSSQKPVVLAEWDATGHEYKSRADFSRIISRREGLKERTVYNWIAAHEKSKP